LTSKMSLALVGALVSVAVLSGCLTNEPLPLSQLSTQVEATENEFQLTFRPHVILNATANETVAPAALSDPSVLPRAVEQLVNGGGAEPNIGVTKKNSVFVTTFDEVRRSRDHGKTWQIVHEFTTPRVPVTEDRWDTADPMLWVDPITDRVFVSHMHPAVACQYLAWSDNDGDTWTERPFACTAPVPYTFDHQKIMTAKHGPKALPIPAPVYPTVFYLCYNAILKEGTWCDVSFDGGLTFTWSRLVLAESRCGSINGHPAAFPDGTVVVPGGSFGNCKREVEVAVTEDNGFTWSTRRCAPGYSQTEIDPDITVTPDGTAYMLFRDDEHIHLLRTKDKFQTCDVFRISPQDHVKSVFTVITSGDNGRIAMAYLASRDPQDPEIPSHPGTVWPGTNWHLYVTTSYDADAENPTFVTQMVSPEEDPIQVGCVWLNGGGGGPKRCRNLLDFMDMTRDQDGRFYVAFTDGCTPRNGCTAQPFQTDFQSRDMEIGVAIMDSGLSLFADKGVLSTLGLEHPKPLPR